MPKYNREIWGVEMNLQVELLEEDSVQRFIIVGEIDAFTAPVLKERLASAQNDTRDCKQNSICQKSLIWIVPGLGCFVGFYKAVKANGGHVKITGVECSA